jgi:hypothetical protein
MASEDKVLKRHEDELMRRLEQVADKGWTHMTWSEVYRWYNAKRIGKSFWRDLQDRYEELDEELEKDDRGELYSYDDGNGVLLIHSNGLKSVANRLTAPE